MLEFHGVTKRYADGRAALDDVSFALSPGEFAYITGPSGAGKSTLLHMIPLIERPSAGRVLFEGEDVTRWRASRIPRLRRRIGVVQQDCKLIAERNVYSNVALPLQVTGEYRSTEIAERVEAALTRVGISELADAYPPELSAGERQRAAIARAIVGRPVLLLADEPAGDVDADCADDVMQLFEQFNRHGVAVLMATHNRALMLRYPHRTWELRRGQLIDGASSGMAS